MENYGNYGNYAILVFNSMMQFLSYHMALYRRLDMQYMSHMDHFYVVPFCPFFKLNRLGHCELLCMEENCEKIL